MHYQVAPFEETKTLWVTEGAPVRRPGRPPRPTSRPTATGSASSSRADDDLALHVPAGRRARLPDPRATTPADLPDRRRLLPRPRADPAVGRPAVGIDWPRAGDPHLGEGPERAAVAARVSDRVISPGPPGWSASGSLRALAERRRRRSCPSGRRTTSTCCARRGRRLVARDAPTDVVHLAWSRQRPAGLPPSDDNARWVDATLELVAACRAARAALWLTGTVVDDRGRDAARRLHRSQGRAAHRTARRTSSAGELGWLRPAYVFDERARPAGAGRAGAAAPQRGEAGALRSPGRVHDFVHAETSAARSCWPSTQRLHGRSSHRVRAAAAGRRPGRRPGRPLGRGSPSPATGRAHADRADDTSWLTRATAGHRRGPRSSSEMTDNGASEQTSHGDYVPDADEFAAAARAAWREALAGDEALRRRRRSSSRSPPSGTTSPTSGSGPGCRSSGSPTT